MRTHLHRAESLLDFISITSDLSNENSSIWFRGQSNSSWGLTPSIYREKYDERSIRLHFERRLPSFISHSALISRWEQYFLLQHHGAPTRLLDWSEGSLISLYFAICDHSYGDSTNAAVWAINPRRLNTVTTGESIIWLPAEGDPDCDEYLPNLDDVNQLYDITGNLPVALMPTHTSPRISAQKGAFTIHGVEMNGFESVASDIDIHKIILPHNNIGTIQIQLRDCGISESVIFPDLDGLCRELKEHYIDSEE